MKKYKTTWHPYIEIRIGDYLTIMRDEESKFGGEKLVTERIHVTEKNIQDLVDASILKEIREEKPVDTLPSLIRQIGQTFKRVNPILSFVDIANTLKAMYHFNKGALIKLVLKQLEENTNKQHKEGAASEYYNQNWRYGLDVNGDITIVSLAALKTFETGSYFHTVKEVTIAQGLFKELLSSSDIEKVIDKAFVKLSEDD